MSEQYCGTPEPNVSPGHVVNRKPHSRVFVSSLPPGVPADAFHRDLQTACNNWSEVCGVTWEFVDRGHYDLVIEAAPIDGQDGVLAWCEFPGPPVQRMRLDSKDSWVWQGSGFKRQGKWLVNVLTHELGHYLGIPHIAPGNLMQPHYDPQLTKPQDGDTREALRRYPPPKPRARPDVQPDGDVVVIRIHGATKIEIPGYRVTREG